MTAAAYALDALIAPAETMAAARRDVLLLALSAVLAWFAAFLLTGAILAWLLGRRAGRSTAASVAAERCPGSYGSISPLAPMQEISGTMGSSATSSRAAPIFDLSSPNMV